MMLPFELLVMLASAEFSSLYSKTSTSKTLRMIATSGFLVSFRVHQIRFRLGGPHLYGSLQRSLKPYLV